MNTRKIQSVISKIAQSDQFMRNSKKWNPEIDAKNAEVLKRIIKEIGWPDSKLVSKRASHFAWLIAQHADHDVVFQEKCLKLMKEKLKKELVDPRDVAFLIDRIKVNKSRKQMYGTQFFVNKNGEFVPRPIYNKKDLNKRRRDVGLGSFASYKGEMRLKNRELDKK